MLAHIRECTEYSTHGRIALKFCMEKAFLGYGIIMHYAYSVVGHSVISNVADRRRQRGNSIGTGHGKEGLVNVSIRDTIYDLR